MLRLTWLAPLVLAACANPQAPSIADRADALRVDGRTGDAYAAYARALCREPARLDLARRLVESWHELGHPGMPLAKLDCEIDPGTSHTIAGLAAAALGQADVAEAELTQAEALVPVDMRGDVAYRRGLVALHAGRFDRAVETLDAAAGFEPARADIRLALAQGQLERGKLAEAAAALRGLMALEPAAAQIEQGRRILSKIVRRAETPLAASIESELTDVLSSFEHGGPGPEQMARVLALAKEVQHSRVLCVAGLVALHRGLQGEAAELLRGAAELNHLDPEPMRMLGASRFTLGQSTDALEPLAEAFRRDPFDVEVARMLATTAVANRRLELARDTYSALILLEPNKAEHFLWLSRMERQLGRLGPALRAAQRGTKLSPADVPLLVEIASIEVQRALDAKQETERRAGKERAMLAIEQLQAVAPEHPGAAALVGSLDAI